MIDITLIAAHGKDRAIGCRGEIPWHYPEDFAHFKRETLGGTLIMGRKTYESIGRPLPGRRTIVLTRDPDWSPDHAGVIVATTPIEAVERSIELRSAIFVAGGGQVYRKFLPLSTRQILTEIPVATPEADAYYPSFDETEWVEDRREVSEENLIYRWLSRKNTDA